MLIFYCYWRQIQARINGEQGTVHLWPPIGTLGGHTKESQVCYIPIIGDTFDFALNFFTICLFDCLHTTTKTTTIKPQQKQQKKTKTKVNLLLPPPKKNNYTLASVMMLVICEQRL